MNTDQRARRLWLVAVVILSLAAVLALAWGQRERTQAQREREQARNASFQLEAGYQRAFFGLVEHVENLELLLSKAMASGSPMHQAVILTRAHAEAMAAQEALANLPVGIELQRSQQFLSQTGDFAYMVAQRLAAGQAPEGEDWKTLARLKSQTAELMRELNSIREQAMRGRFLWTEVARQSPQTPGGTGGDAPPSTDPGSRGGSGEPGPSGDAATAAAGDAARPVPQSLQELDRELQEVPSLVYDGPFSEQNLRPEPRSDLGEMVRRDEALRRALAFVAGGDAGRWRAEAQGEAVGPIPAYVFSLEPEGGRDAEGGGAAPYTVHVSQEGGRVLWFLGAQDEGDGQGRTAVGLDEARDRAASFLRERGLERFTDRGWVREDGRVTFSFVRETADGVLIYPEQIKVTVDAGGRVVGYDARAFWLNREPDRQLPRPSVRREDVRGLASPLLDVSAVRLAVIPLPSGQHVLAYEVLGELEGDRFLVYYNALSGREELILRVVETADMRLGF